ncbi:MAG: phosphohydrolase [Betaproteobacteria bacterium]|jgi:phosphonate degradation associated HDIG domain protein|nr:phosphohydrolase [Betaproteobacteria bacterium]NBS47973.1 phosphohydrolase [Betaproteobacteria bacterium]
MALSLHDIEHLYRKHGDEQYSGEPVSQIEHALQCAALAEAEGADDELVTAAFLHDLGHLLHDLGETPSARGIDDVHQYRVLPFLRGVFSERVLNAISMHVDAKRYLCATRPEYYGALSEDSRRSLKLQGGTFDENAAQQFISQTGAQDAVRIRIWDDCAKVAGQTTPGLDHFMQRLRRCALAGAGA